MELVRAPMVLLFQSKASRIAIFYSDNPFRLAPNSKMVIFLISYPHVVFFLLEVISPLAFLYSFSDKHRMKSDYKIRECLTSLLMCLQYEPLTCLKSFSSLLFGFLITAFSYPSKIICYTSLVAGVHSLSTKFLYAYQSGKSPFQTRKRKCKC